MPATRQANIRNAGESAIDEARTILRKGGPVIYPTSTLYALGVDARNSSAIDLVFNLKKRPETMPISIAVTNIGMAREFAVIDESHHATIQALRELPITFVVSSKSDIHDGLVGNDSTLAFRFPQHPVAEALIDGYGPLTTTSANIHGKEDPVEVEQAASQFGATVPLYIRGRTGKFGRLTTLLDIRRDELRIIRYGAATRSEIQCALVGRKVM